MTMSRMTKVFALVLSLTIGNIGSALSASEDTHPLPSILNDIEHHIAELTMNIENISERMKFLQNAPISKDPLIQEVLNLDLRGWELHKEQWNLQLDNLRFTEGLLRKVQDNPQEKSEALKAWQNHIEKFKESMEGYRKQRAGVEVLRIETASRLIEQYLR
jgi:hypothetical protein